MLRYLELSMTPTAVADVANVSQHCCAVWAAILYKFSKTGALLPPTALTAIISINVIEPDFQDPHVYPSTPYFRQPMPHSRSAPATDSLDVEAFVSSVVTKPRYALVFLSQVLL